MSGFGLAGFGTGFIQGFDAMGSQFARRGLLQREAEQSRRQDRTLALEEELKRQEAVRQEREAISQNAQRDLETDILRKKFPYVADSAKAQMQAQQGEVESQNLRNELTKKTMGSSVDTAASQAEIEAEKAKRLRLTTPDYVATSGAATREANAGATTAEANAYVADNTKTDKVRSAQYAADSAKGQSQSDLAKGGIAPDMEAAQLRQVKADTEGTEVGTQGKKLDNQGKQLEVGDKQRIETQRATASQAMNNIKSGNYTAEDLDAIAKLGPVAKLASNPELIGDARNIIGAVQEGAKAGGDVAAFNQPNVLDSLNRVFSDSVTRTRGMPLDKDGMLVAGDSRIVEMVRNPKDNLIGFTLEVRPEPNPQRKDLLQKALQNASTPQQRQAIEAELNPMPYRVALTDGRMPAAQGGQQRWFTPDEVKKAVMGVASVANLKERNPQVLQDLLDVHGKIERGEVGETDGKALDNEIKVRKENRENREEMRKVEGDTRTQKKEKRAERSDAFKEAASIIDKQYSTVDQLTGIASFQGDNGQKAADEKLMVDKVLRRNPNMSGAQALEKARRIMAKQGKNPAQSSAKAGVTGKKDFSALW